MLVDLLYNNSGQAVHMANNEYHAIKFLKIPRQILIIYAAQFCLYQECKYKSHCFHLIGTAFPLHACISRGCEDLAWFGGGILLQYKAKNCNSHSWQY